MRTARVSRSVNGGAVALLLAVAMLAGVGTSPRDVTAAPLRPLVVGWEQFFTLKWTAGQHRGRPVVSGQIYNNWNFAAANVRLLVDALDAQGQIVDQTVGWLGFTLTPGTTAPFEVPVNHATPNYRVSVFAFDWIQADGSRRGRF